MDLTFLSQDVVSGRILGDLRIVNFRVTERINDYGDWSGTLMLDPHGTFSQIELTEPVKTRIFALVDERPVYALDVWGRDRQLGDLRVPLSGKLAGSWFERVTIGGRDNRDLRYNAQEQQTIARNLLNSAISEYGSAGLNIPAGMDGVPVIRDKNTWDASDGKPYGEALVDLANQQNGFQFRFEPYGNPDTGFGVRLTTGAPFLVDRPPVYAEYTSDGVGGWAGNVRALRVNDSLSSYASDVVVWGSGEGKGRLRGKATRTTPGIPAIVRQENRNDVITQSWLTSRARTIMSASTDLSMPPIISLSANDENHPLGSYTVGDRMAVFVDDCPQFPGGLQGMWRIFEIEWNPQNNGDDVLVTIGEDTD